MPVLNRIAAFSDEMKAWRRHLHAHPELEFDCFETAAFIEERLREIGVDEIHTGIAKTGIVALIRGSAPGPVIGLRADMDALPIAETSGAAHASKVPGRAHSCGHDGHVTMLLGAAKYLSETRRFAGTVALIFQPAEEEGGGGEVMVQEGALERFAISEVYGIHNAPNRPLGQFDTTPGPLMAAVDTLYLTVTGKGGHAANPHEVTDPLIALTGMVQALQTIVSRNSDPNDSLVISVTQIHGGTATNIIPETAMMTATIRSFTPHMRDLAEARIRAILAGHAAAYGVTLDLIYERGYPPTVNDAAKAGFAAEVAREISGADLVDAATTRQMGAEDFSYMLEARPGAYLFLGTGEGPGLHHPAYDFNDEAAPIGASFFARLVERALPLA